MGGVFISYRGGDSQSYGALIYGELSRRFGADRVYLDVESTAAGEDFVDVLLDRLRGSSVLLAVIGPHWLTITDEVGRRRIDSPHDWVRRELIEAFAYNLRVVPILTDDAKIPEEADLPADIAALHRRQALRLHHRTTRSDLARIVEELGGFDPELAEAARRHDSVPRQLPAAPQFFVGRDREMANLTEVFNPDIEQARSPAAVVISAIGGEGGIGKTALAVHWAHQNVERFPDGQLYVNLRGFDPSSPPTSPTTALRGFLDALGVDPGAIPVDGDAQAGLFRSLVAGKRMLIVLDNARDTAHVTPLLPGSPTCSVLITSRRQLSGLITTQGARPLPLNVLTDVEAKDLLRRCLGWDRVATEPQAMTDLIAYCAGLPLALAILAARAAAHPDFPLAVFAEELRQAVARLDALDGGELSADLRAVFSCSYEALDPQTRSAFSLLGVAPGPDIGLAAAASLIALPLPRARALLRKLELASLVQQQPAGRYRMHDLTRLYAAERALGEHSPADRDAAMLRLVDFYLHTAHGGDRQLDPLRPAPIELGQAAAGCLPYALTDPTTALAWFDAEHSCLLAVQQLAAEREWYRSAWQLAWTLSSFQYRRAHFKDYAAVWRIGLLATERLGSPTAQALAHRLLGQACTWGRMNAEAVDHLRHALKLAEKSDDLHGQAHTLRALAWYWGRQGDYRKALNYARRALPIYEALGNPAWEAAALNLVGWQYARIGQHEHARELCEKALVQNRENRNWDGLADALVSLGYISQNSGQYTLAVDYYRQALRLFRLVGSTYDEANVLVRLGEVHVALGQHGDARDVWQQALELYRLQHRAAEAERIGQQLTNMGQ